MHGLATGITKNEVERGQVMLMGILRRLGFFISFRKTRLVVTRAHFLGIVVDSEDKLIKMLEILF